MGATSSSNQFRSRVFIGLMLLVAGGVACAAWWWTQTPKERAERALSRGRLHQAAGFFEEHLRQHPDDDAARLALGKLWATSVPGRAVETLSAIDAGSPSFLDAQRRIAEIAIESGDFRLAEASLGRIIERAPDDFPARVALTRLLHRQLRSKEALPHALRATELKPAEIEPWLLVAELYDDLKRTSEMVPPLRRALELAPDHPDVRLNLCYALVWSGDFPAARVEAAWCLERDPDNVPARRFLAMCEREEGNPERALEEIERALRIAPDDYECRLVQGQLLLFQRKGEEAFQSLRPMLARHGRDRRLLTLLARAAAASGRRELAEEYQKRSAQATADKEVSSADK